MATFSLSIAGCAIGSAYVAVCIKPLTVGDRAQIQALNPTRACRALKTKGNTPKYGLIFHSSFIGRAKQKNKGRISRYLANKCSIASRRATAAPPLVSAWRHYPAAVVFTHLVQIRHAAYCYDGLLQSAHWQGQTASALRTCGAGPTKHKMASCDCLQTR